MAHTASCPKIAYLAPEIPALSATFVYNEILAMERIGFEIVPISVHKPIDTVDNDEIRALANKTECIYTKSIIQIIRSNIWCLLHRPARYGATIGTMIADSLKVGLFTHTGLGLVYRFFVSATVAEILSKQQCRHLHAHFAHIPTDIAMYSANIVGIPFSFTSHANDLFQRGWLLKEKVDRAAFSVTISEYNKQFLERSGANSSSIHVIHCGVDTLSFNNASHRSNNTTLVIGTLGRAVEKKGFATLLSSIAILKNQGITPKLMLAGDGPLLEGLKQQAYDLGIIENVVFCGAIAHDDVANWMQLLDVFALPCQKDKNGDMDGIPVVLMEAMMMEVPVVSTRITGIPELVINNSTGLLVTPSDAENLASAILRLHMDRTLTSSLTKEAKKIVQQKFDLTSNTKRLANLITGAAG